MPLPCSVIIRCFNEERHIGRLLAGIAHQSVRPAEVLLVDSGSTDRTLEVASRHPVRILRIPREEFSFGRSLNLGCRAARGEVLVLASAHTYSVYDDWIERLLAPFADPAVALVYGKQRGNGLARFSEQQVFQSWFPDTSNPNQAHAFCNNANAAIRRSVWERVPYDESLTGLEDIAWAKQVLALGHRVVYEAAAEVIHVHEERPSQVFNRYKREAIAMKTIEPACRFTWWDFCRLLAANVVSDCRSAARQGKLRRQLLDILLFRLVQFWGTYRGHLQYGPVTEQLRTRFYYPRSTEGALESRPRRDATPIDYALEKPLGPDP